MNINTAENISGAIFININVQLASHSQQGGGGGWSGSCYNYVTV